MNMRIQLLISLIGLFLSLFVKAEDVRSLSLGGKSFPSQANLSNLFLPTIPNQGRANTCHVYAAVDLMESYCFQITHVAIPLSENYFIYRHLRALDDKLSYLPPNVVANDVLLGEKDGGYSDETLHKMLNGSLLTETEFPTDGALVEAVTLAKVKSGNDSPTFLNLLGTNLDNYFLKKVTLKGIDAKQSPQGGFFSTTKDRNLLNCIGSQPEVHHESFSLKRAVSLLSAGIPFVLNADWVYPDGKTYRHAVVIDGYRQNSSLDQNEYQMGIEFHMRNSATGSDTWGVKISPLGGDIDFLSPVKTVELETSPTDA